MVTRAELPIQSGGGNFGIQLATLLTNVAGTTEKTTSTPDAGAMGNSNSVFGQAMATSNNPQSALVDSILEQSAINFAPTLGTGTGGVGLYNSSTVNLLRNNARAAAVSQSTKAVLEAQQNALNTAASVSNQQLATTKTTTAVNKPNISDLLTQALPGILLGTVVNKFGGKVMDSVSKTFTDALGGGNSNDTVSFMEGRDTGASGNIGNVGTDGTVNSAAINNSSFLGLSGSEMAGKFGGGLAGILATTMTGLSGIPGMIAGSLVSSMVNRGIQTGLQPAATESVDNGMSVSDSRESGDLPGNAPQVNTYDFSNDISSDDVSGNNTVPTAIGIPSADVLATGYSPGAANTAYGVGNFGSMVNSGDNYGTDAGGSDSSTSPTVICTELYYQNRIPSYVYLADRAFGAQQSEYTIAGYHLWAKPVVKLMKISPVISGVVAFFALAWAQHMAFLVIGETKLVKQSQFGKLIMFIGLPLCNLLGRLVLSHKKFMSRMKGAY